MIKAERTTQPRICQGDIIKDVECIEYASEKEGIIEVSKIVFPLAIVLTQDCDLEQDHKVRLPEALVKDKCLISVLLAPLYNAEHVYQGEHLQELGIKMESVNKNKSPGKFLRNNERDRYHYLEFGSEIPVVSSIIDFKHYFSANVNYLRELKKSNFVCTVSPLFREDVSHRFACFLARIGLPELGEKSTE